MSKSIIIPKTWYICSISQLADIISGGTPKAGNPENFSSAGTGIAWLTPADLSHYKAKTISYGRRDLSEIGYKSSSAKLMPEGSVLFSSRAPIGYVVIANNEISTNQGFKSFVFSQKVSCDYAYYYLKNIRSLAESLGRGTTFKELSGKAAKSLPFVLPPLAEQKEIATRLDHLLAQVNTLKTRLDAIPILLKRFRQSVLAAAVSGKLTNTTGKFVKIGNIASEIRYGTSKKCTFNEGKTPVLRIPNIGNRRLNIDKLKFADFNEKELDKLALQVGDLLIIRSNGSVDLVGKAAVVTDKESNYLFAGYLIRIRLDQDIALPNYVLYCLQSPQMRKIIEIQARSTSGVNNINSKELANLELLLPSIQEQTEIVTRVETLFTFADKIEQHIQQAQNKVNQLTPSLLAKAFRGELTADWREQHPELISGENSAKALLERIQAEREKLKPTGKKRARKAKKR